MANYDLIIIGGGINGLGIAAEAATAGLSVLLADKSDWGAGTTSTSSRLIHGGLRYLQYGELGLVRESLHERGRLARRYPHLIHPIELMIPVYRGVGVEPWMLQVGLKLYDLLARDPLFTRPRRLSKPEIAAREPGLSHEALDAGFVYPDAQVEFPERVCVELARGAAGRGAVLLNHTRLTQLVWEQGRVIGCVLIDELNGKERVETASLVINAAGPWVDAVNRLLPQPPPRLIGGTWGTHLVLPLRPEGPRHHLYATAKRDGRPFFILPWDGRLLVGTTDVKYEGNPDEVRVEEWEIAYLLEELNRLFPAGEYTEADVQMTTIGVRPLPASHRKAGAVTRRHFLVDHEVKHGIRGLASVVGGKLTTFRSLGESVVGWALDKLQRGRPSGSEESAELPDLRELRTRVQEEAGRLDLPLPVGDRLVAIYGARATEVLSLGREQPNLLHPLHDTSPALRAEVIYALQREQARTVEDIAERRLMLLPADRRTQETIRDTAAEMGLRLS